MLDILFQSPEFVAVNKPSGFIVHKSRSSRGALDSDNCMALLREQLGKWVYPLHRLDRGTSGALLFGLSPEAARMGSAAFQNGEIRKAYWAVVRGFAPEDGIIDRPLTKNGKGAPKQAVTAYKRLAVAELPFQVSPRYPSTRYSLVCAKPQTGRYHQIRRHLASISHPLIGDTMHGEGRHNRFFREKLGSSRLLLHARSLRWVFPGSVNSVEICAPLPDDFKTVLLSLGWSDAESIHSLE